MGRHRLLFGAAVVLVCGGGAAGAVLATGSSSYVGTRSTDAALVKTPLVGSGGMAGTVYQIGVPTILHFAPNRSFGIAVVLTNEANVPITMEGIRAVLVPGSPMHQIGTRVEPYKPFVCPPGALCPFIDIATAPFGAERLAPFSLAPGAKALAQMNFRYAACGHGGHSVVARKFTVVYRTPGGAVINQRLRLGDSSPQLMSIPSYDTCR